MVSPDAHRNRRLTLPSLSVHPGRWREAWRAYRADLRPRGAR